MTAGESERTAVRRVYSQLAGEYDARWSSYVAASTRETLARIALGPTDRVLDVGCGTGYLLAELARAYPGARLAGVDPVPEMLAVARRRLAPAVELREGWVQDLPFADGSFDVVVSCNMFHHVRAPAAALHEMGRLLRGGGRLVITDWCDDYLSCRLCNLYLRRFDSAHFKAYRRRECIQLLAEAGYPDAAIERYKISWLWGLMTAQAAAPTTHSGGIVGGDTEVGTGAMARRDRPAR